MRYIKILGLAAVAAMALMAFLGAGTASAATLCKTEPNENNECPAEWHYPIETSIHVTQKAGTSAILEETGGTTLDTCTTSTVRGKTTSTGGLNKPVEGNIEALTWGTETTKCTAEATISLLNADKTFGQLSVEATTKGNGSLSGKNNRVTVKLFGTSCVYGTGAGTTLGTVTGGKPATVSVNAVINKLEGSFLCPTTTKWTASYIVTEPTPMWIANG